MIVKLLNCDLQAFALKFYVVVVVVGNFYFSYCLNLSDFLQTKSKLYLILDFVNGGHLFFHLYRQGIFRYCFSLFEVFYVYFQCCFTYKLFF